MGVPVVIQNSKGEILLGKRSNKVFYPGYWGLPGGLVDYGEGIKETAKREVREELNVDVKILKQGKEIYEVFPDENSNLQSINVLFYAKIISGTPEPKDETVEIKWFKSSEIREIELAYSHKKILKEECLI